MAIEASFASIVGLLSNFASERRSVSEDEYKEFRQWLSDKRYKGLLEELNSNHLLSNSIKLLLKNNHTELISKLDYLNNQLSMLASRIPGLEDLSESAGPKKKLPSQCIAILKTLDKHNGRCFIERRYTAGIKYSIPDAGISFTPPDPRFLEDDLNTMLEFDLLLLDHNSKGERKFHVTRNAIALLQQISTPPVTEN